MSHWKVGGDVIAYWRKGVGTTLIASNGQRYGSWLFLVIDNSSGIKGLTGIKPSVFGKLVKKTFLGMVLSLAWKPLSNTNILCCSITTNFFFQCLYFQNKIHFSCTVVVFPFFFYSVSLTIKKKKMWEIVWFTVLTWGTKFTHIWRTCVELGAKLPTKVFDVTKNKLRKIFFRPVSFSTPVFLMQICFKVAILKIEYLIGDFWSGGSCVSLAEWVSLCGLVKNWQGFWYAGQCDFPPFINMGFPCRAIYQTLSERLCLEAKTWGKTASQRWHFKGYFRNWHSQLIQKERNAKQRHLDVCPGNPIKPLPRKACFTSLSPTAPALSSLFL